jgi:hypothetical protein
MAFFGFEYFCGANVVIEIEDFPILEAVGLSMNIKESQMPIYGYSSRHFDAVARGQVIVQGSLLINYVNHDYLHEAIAFGLRDKGLLLSDSQASSSIHLEDVLGSGPEGNAFAQEALDNYGNSTEIVKALKDKFWLNQSGGGLVNRVSLPNPHDSFGGLDIKVTFGERAEYNQWLGNTGFLISNAYFTGRGQMIEVDENVIVEEYPFFARNLYGLRQQYRSLELPLDGIDASGGTTNTIVLA